MENQPDERLENPLADIVPGSVQCFDLNQMGLFVAGNVSTWFILSIIASMQLLFLVCLYH